MSTETEVQSPDSDDMAAKGVVVASMTFLSRVSGFVRDVMLSYFLGATGLADAFFVAFRIPNFFRRLFAEGAFNQAFVPVLARYKKQSADELKLFVAVMAGNLGLVVALVVLVGVLFSEVLVALFAPGFWGVSEQFELATDMVRITFPYLGFIALTAFAGAVLNTHQRFAVPAFTPVLLNLTLIAAMVIAAATTQNMVFALAWGVFAAGVVQLLFQAPSMARLELLVVPRLSRSHEGAQQVGRLLVPAVLAASVGQINSLIDTMLASMLITGSISWLYYADRLLELPIGLVAVALGTVLLPNLSRIADSGDARAFAATIDWGMRTGLVLAIPASVALFLLADPLIATIFYHGVLTVLDVSMAALALKAFAVGAVAMVLVKVLAPAFFAHQEFARLENKKVLPTPEMNEILTNLSTAKMKKPQSLKEILRRTEISYKELCIIDEESAEISGSEIADQVEMEVKYEGYIKRQLEQIEKFKKLESIKIPVEFYYDDIPGLSNEIIQKLTSVKPDSLGQATRISGITPAAISVLMVYIKKIAETPRINK